ncbi:MAG TPA: benzaldehyde dehydrogenase [Pseudolysinimonas sp.]|nr:benzaldehyde dehydrogenase [Pseudolysinimonas sp.]
MSFFDQTTFTTGSGETVTVVSPATGETLGSYTLATPADLAVATARAEEAQRAWAASSFEDKAAVFRRAGALIKEHADVLAGWLMREAGSGQGKAAFETHLVASEFHLAAATTLAPYGQLLRSGKPRLSLARRIPVGTVGVISPFNFPAILAMRSVAPALATGNAVILKPDPRTTVSGGLFLAAILEEAGLPSDVLQVLPGRADIGIGLVEAPSVRVISFTGSTAAGRAVGELAGRHLKRAHLELGGNNALIVLDDVDVPAAVSAGAWGSFLHQGQICMTTGRHFVQDAIYDEYVERLAATADGIPVGDPTTGAPLGPIIDAGQRDKIHALVTGSVDGGARLAAGGTYDGLFYRPTVLADSAPDHPAFADEVFGPVAPVMRFSTIDELVELATRSDYGLSLGILAKDAFRAFELSERIPSGIVHINDQTVDDEAVAPFGGVGASGTGSRFGGIDANIEAFTETQWVTVQSEIERYPF